jgi:hypothetical protein
MASPGVWQVGASKKLIVETMNPMRYRISNKDLSGNSKGVQIVIDGTEHPPRLLPGETRDVQGKKIEINQPEGTPSSGTFDNLD